MDKIKGNRRVNKQDTNWLYIVVAMHLKCGCGCGGVCVREREREGERETKKLKACLLNTEMGKRP